MTCRELVDFLSDYLDGQLPSDVAERFQKHLDCCPPCVCFLNTYKTGAELARAALADEDCCVPEELVRAILAARKA